MDLGARAEDDGIGSSFAVNGVCLTATRYQGSVVCFDVSAETLTKSTIGTWRADGRVNIERALRLALGRPPRDEEVRQCVELVSFLRREQGQTLTQAMKNFCLMVYNLNEFIFLD